MLGANPQKFLSPSKVWTADYADYADYADLVEINGCGCYFYKRRSR